MSLLHDLRYFFEKRGFEVCSRMADRLGMKAKHVRIFFIYLSFFHWALALRYIWFLPFGLK